jgi:hypothetical protein
MLRKTPSARVSVWAYRLSYFAGALFLLNALATLAGWDSFANQPPGSASFNLAESVVFFSVGFVFNASHRKAK